MCVRAVGYKWNICVIQFVKGSWKYGELKGIKRLEPNVELHVIGEGFVGILDDKKEFAEHQQAARKGLALAMEKIRSGKYQLVILDEINVALHLKLIDEEGVRELLQARGEKQHLVFTGRNAAEWIKQEADLVTEMVEVKHPYQQGVLAQKGIDW